MVHDLCVDMQKFNFTICIHHRHSRHEAETGQHFSPLNPGTHGDTGLNPYVRTILLYYVKLHVTHNFQCVDCYNWRMNP